jgi:proteic killer suppression protein
MTTDGLQKNMIKSFKSRQLKRLFERGDGRSLPPQHLQKVEYILRVLHRAKEVSDIDLPGFALHRIGGNYNGFWSVSVQGPWRVIFKFEGKNVVEVDYLDYH